MSHPYKKSSTRSWLQALVKLLSCVRLFAAPRTVACQAPPSMGFSRQEYWSGLPFPSPEDLPDQGSNLGFPPCRQTLLPSEPPWHLLCSLFSYFKAHLQLPHPHFSPCWLGSLQVWNKIKKKEIPLLGMRTGLSLIQYVESCDNCIFYADLIYIWSSNRKVETLASAWQPPLCFLHFSSIKKFAALYVNQMSYIFHFEKIYPWCFDAERLPHDIFFSAIKVLQFWFHSFQLRFI